jgi:hypothetical protein
LAFGLIVTTDTTFSSNRFAWTHQVHKLDRKSKERNCHVSVARLNC